MNTAILKKSHVHLALSQRLAVGDLAIEAPATAKSHSLIGSIVLVVSVIGGVLALSHFTHSVAATQVATSEPQLAVLPRVSTAKPERSQQKTALSLPAEIDAFQATAMYARIRGYLKSWTADRGDRVTAGQALAIIDAPEFDQDLRRAQADLLQGKAEAQQARTDRDQAIANVEVGEAQIVRAQANVELAAKTVERFKGLVEKWAASQQQYDEAVRSFDVTKAELLAAKADSDSRKAAVASKKAAIDTAEARVDSLAANIQRMKELETFKTVTAPFSGTITKRFVDVGAYIPDDGSKPLFSIIQDDVLRVVVNVPQTFAPSVKSNQEATVTLREMPGRKFSARVSRTARMIDPAARTLTVELELANKENLILPGSFAQVNFALNVENAPLTIPASTLKMTKEGTKVVLVGSDRRIRIQTVELGRDMGARVEVVAGLSGDETLVINPADSLTEGTRVDSAPEVAAK